MTESQARPQFAIDSAPGKQLIEQLAGGGATQILADFFQDRMAWCGGYPLVHDRLVTYGAFDDLLSALTTEQQLALLPSALHLANTASDQTFHAALALLAKLIPDDCRSPRPEGFSTALLWLKLRAERLSFLPNLSCTWDGLAQKQRYLYDPNDPLRRYTPHQLALDCRWKAFFPFPLLNNNRSRMKDCLASLPELRSTIQTLGCLPGERRLIYVTRIDDVGYWVWQCPGRPGTAHLARLVFLRQPPSGDLGLGYWDLYQQFHECVTPEAISHRLLKIEFYPHDLVPIARTANSAPTVG